MTINYQKLKDWPFEQVRHEYSWKDAALYALGVGYGADPLDQGQLQFVYEGAEGATPDGTATSKSELKVVPSMAVVLAGPGFWVKQPESGVDWVKVLHGEQSLTLHKPLPAGGAVLGKTRVTRIVDKGRGKAAILVSERQLHDASSGELLATQESLTFCRGDGGFSELPDNGPAGGDAPPEAKPKVPDRAPDRSCEMTSVAQAALIYRLCADLNPLHADPSVAKAAGFQRPILHGLASFGMAVHAILKTCCGYDPARLASVGLRFSAPVYPGETLITDIWETDLGVQFQTRVKERDIVAMSHGIAQLNAG